MVKTYLHPDDYFYAERFAEYFLEDPCITTDLKLLNETVKLVFSLAKNSRTAIHTIDKLKGIYLMCESKDVQTIQLAKSLILDGFISINEYIYSLFLRCIKYNLFTNEDYLCLFNANVSGSFLQTLSNICLLPKEHGKQVINFLNERHGNENII